MFKIIFFLLSWDDNGQVVSYILKDSATNSFSNYR